MMLWFHFLLAAAILGFLVWSRRTDRRREVFYWGGAVLIALCCLGAAAAWPGLLPVQKTLTALAMPCGLIWLLLLGTTLLTWQRRRAWLWNLVLLLLLTLAGNNTVASLLTSWLQQPFAAIDPLDAGDFDAIVVLGGGAGRRTDGVVQVNSSGDRVVLAARLYHAGRTPTLVAAGDDSSQDRLRAADRGDPMQFIWRELQIPDDAMVSISGRNTREEIMALRGLVEARQWRRVGLITSAWHMRRAMRLARAQEVTLQPLPADFRGDDDAWNEFSLIPNGGAMCDIQLGVKELLAMVVGR